MDRHRLHEVLREAGVPEGRYEIQGCPGGPWPADRLYLEEQGGRWVVGVHERGRREVLERFEDEDRACRRFYRMLTDEGPPPVPLSAAEAERLLRSGEDVQRGAREEPASALEPGCRDDRSS
ncbi:hypothetical protein [Peterkaempfera griseoplana]|uniref:hypothetical protein n=1 Tax=Peterkaempfera griseoplana TaxID=66896 RepID=UPI0006E42A08|nr:hypothetical protein [Peterkaempfera griseoplana]